MPSLYAVSSFCMSLGFPGGLAVKNLAKAGDTGLILGLGKPPGEGNILHSSLLAWRTPWTE